MVKSAARYFVLGASLLCAAPVWAQGPSTSSGQAYPAKPVRVVVGFSAGSTTDLIGRVLALKLGDGLGHPVVVDNRPGAGANIAAELVAKSPPDGYTLLMANAGIATGATAYVKLNFNALRDFAPVTEVDRKSTRLNSSHIQKSRMPSSA